MTLIPRSAAVCTHINTNCSSINGLRSRLLSIGHGKPGKVLELKKWLFPSLKKVLEKNVIPKVLEKSWTCYIHMFIHAV